MKKVILTALCSVLTGFVLCGIPHIPVHAASADSSYDECQEEIDELVASGKFDSDSLTDEQLDYIYEAYDGDPEAISELQKQSDANASAKLQTIDTSGYTHDSRYADYDVINGIDISAWQGTIDWEAVKADGVEFALIRVAYRGYGSAGTLSTDTMYKTNIQGALDAGLDVGVYIYSQAITVAEAKEEANYILNLIGDYSINLPVIMDFEYAATGVGRLYNAYLSVSEATKICKAFCAQVESKNYTAMVYANKSMLSSSLTASSIASLYPIWLAQYPSYDSSTGSKHASYTGTYSYWQYTSSGSVSGISGNVDMDFRYIKKPDTVTGLDSTDSDITSITLSWDKVSGAYGYRIYRLNTETGSYEYIGSKRGANKTTYTDSDLDINTSYTYKVRAFYKLTAGNIYGGYSDEITAVTEQKTVTNLKVSSRTDTTLTLKWDAQSGVTGYRVSRLNSETGKYEVVAYVSGASTNKYKDTGLNCGTTYYYKVRAYYDENGVKSYFDYSNKAKKTTLPGQVSGLTYTSTKKSVTISWNAQENVDGYRIYVLGSNSKWTKIKTIKSATKTSYTYSGLKSNKKYQFSVIAYYTSSSKTVTTKRSATLNAVTKPVAVKDFSATAASKTSVKLSWKKYSNISGYVIYMKTTDSSSWQKVTTVKSASTTSYTVTGLKSSTEYSFRIQAYRKLDGKTVKGTASDISIRISPKKVTKLTIKKYGSKYLLSWKAQSGVSGYYVYRYDTETQKSTKLATIKSANINTCIVSKAASSKYEYYVVAYNKYSSSLIIKGTKSAAATKVTDTQTLTVTAKTLNVRKNTKTSSSIVAKVSKGTKLTVKSVKSNKYGDWYYVSFKKNGKTYKGYVLSDYVKMK